MTAILDENRTYRYRLSRSSRSAASTPPTLWVMLNPSTADETEDDSTIRKVLGFARLWAAGQQRQRGELVVVNLFALRATDPVALRQHPDPVGLTNDGYIEEAADHVTYQGGRIVVAWGAHRFARERAAHVAALVREYQTPYCLGVTKDGSPRHPLYVPYSQPLIPWEGY